MDRAASLEKQDLLQEKLATVDTTRALLAEENMQLEKQVHGVCSRSPTGNNVHVHSSPNVTG